MAVSFYFNRHFNRVDLSPMPPAYQQRMYMLVDLAIGNG